MKRPGRDSDPHSSIVYHASRKLERASTLLARKVSQWDNKTWLKNEQHALFQNFRL